MGELDERIEQLEARIGALEDRLALYQLVATYGPAVDSGSAEVAADLWVEDGTYDTTSVLQGRAGIAGMVRGEGHQSLIANGCAHVMALPHLRIDGDRAVAVGHSRVYLRDGDGFRVWRASSNRWEFVRTDEGWKVAHRVNRALDGSAEARQIFSEGVGG